MELEGKYPKEFEFVGWHPHCRCHAIPILEKPEDFLKRQQALLQGQHVPPLGAVKQPPQNFLQHLKNNSDRLQQASKRGTLPYFIRDNYKVTKKEELTPIFTRQKNQPKLSIQEVAKARQKARTQEEIKDIKRRWIKRRVKNYYTTYREFKNGGTLKLAKEFNREDKQKPDFYKVRRVGEVFARQGHKVEMPHPIHFKDELYKIIFRTLIGTQYERKCPDLIIDDKAYEFEGYLPPWSKRKVGNMINHGLKQASNIILDNTKGCSDRYILRLIHSRVQRKNIGEVWVYEKGKLRRLK